MMAAKNPAVLGKEKPCNANRVQTALMYAWGLCRQQFWHIPERHVIMVEAPAGVGSAAMFLKEAAAATLPRSVSG